MKRIAITNSGLQLPHIVFGTSSFGNLYEPLSEEAKFEITKEWLQHVEAPVFLDTAGKYGAGLALEAIGDNLRRLEVPAERVVISNKLGWKRVPLRGPAATFEPGIWADLKYDAEQSITAVGVLECWRQGCELLGAPYQTQMVSVHDPDEYLAAANTPLDADRRWAHVLDAYRVLHDLKLAGQVQAVGIGCKDWRIIRRVADAVALDWVMLANSLTIYRHPSEIVQFVDVLAERGTTVINSAIFHSGFLTGGRYFDYRIATPENDGPVFAWREAFLTLCRRHGISPMVACVHFAMSHPAVASVSLNTSRPGRIAENVAAVEATIPIGFWNAVKDAGLIAHDYPYVG